ncbi:MAG: hypothetical protein AMJ42_05950 [Deltaproteobacteria bacterium DG_8]|nr:MAG: hypothetical protein AMJ42_05950 [Deltaproteobacteria bacterium DG_8]
MQKIIEKKRGGTIAGISIFLVILSFISLSLAQEKSEPSPCPKPYIKLIKPNLARAGQKITIRGHRFGSEEKSGEVVFPPGLNGKIISWSNSRITIEVPSGAETGKVVVKTKCAESNGEFFKVAQ